MARSLRLEFVLAYDQSDIWAALTEEAALSDWLMPSTRYRPLLGQRFVLHDGLAGGAARRVHCTVLEFCPQSRFSFAWRCLRVETVVRFTLSSAGSSTTLLVVEQKGFRGLRGFIECRRLASRWNILLEERLPRLLQRSRATPDWFVRHKP